MHEHVSFAGADPAGLAAMLVALFLTGLTGGFAHCVGMCAPFVLAQVGGGLAARPAGVPAPPVGLARLRGGLLLPYHLGRLTTYAGLGGLSGALSGYVVRESGFSALLGVVLSGAMLLFVLQGLRAAGIGWAPALGEAAAARFGAALARPLRAWFAQPTGTSGYLLGVALGFLPCGFLYAALAAAMGAGSAAGGFLAMAAFAAGTVPPLMVVGVLGSAAGSGWAGAMRRLAPALYLVNAVLLGAAAWRALF